MFAGFCGHVDKDHIYTVLKQPFVGNHNVDMALSENEFVIFQSGFH